MAHGDNLLARLTKATNNPAATILLARMLFWHKNGKGRQIDGEKWTPNSISDWMKETGLSFQQVRTAIKQIEKLHLAETKVAPYATRSVLHSRPTQRAVAIAEGNLDEISEEPPCPEQQGNVLPTTSDLVTSNTGACCQQHAIQGDTQGENKEKITSELFSAQEDFGPNEKAAGKVKKMNMTDTLKKKLAEEIMHTPDTHKSVEFVWKNLTSDPNAPFVDLKAKDHGNLAQLRKLWPKGQTEAIMTAVVENWIEFTKMVEQDAGAKISPAKPQIGFLLQYAAIAVIFHQSRQLTSPPAPKSHEAAKEPAPPTTPNVQSTAHQDKPATHEEVLAILKG